MKLTVEDVAQLTGLAPGTVREYARRMGVGKLEGRRKYFTKAEAKQIESGELPKPAKKVAASGTRSKAKTLAKRR